MELHIYDSIIKNYYSLQHISKLNNYHVYGINNCGADSNMKLHTFLQWSKCYREFLAYKDTMTGIVYS